MLRTGCQRGVGLKIALVERRHRPKRTAAEYTARLRLEGLLTPDGRVFATHIAHAGNPPHPQLAVYAAGHGYDVAYDGLSVLLNG